MKFYFLLFVLFVSGTRLSSQHLPLNTSTFSDKDYLIELPYTKVKGKLIVEIQIQNEVLQFIFDTGAPTAILKEVSDRLGLKVLAKEDIIDINMTHAIYEFVNTDTIVLGESIVLNTPAIVIGNNLMTDCFQVDGLLGSNLFHDSVIQFDERNSVIKISNTIKSFDVSDVKGSDMYTDMQSSPILEVQLGKDIQELLLFDTGDDCLYTMSNEDREKFEITDIFQTVSKSVGSTSIGINGLEKPTTKYKLSISEFRFQNLLLYDVICETTNDFHSRVGSQLLDYGVFTIDYKNGKSYFQPYPEHPEPDRTFWELNPTYIDDELVVGRVWSQKLDNVSVGDRIISINHHNMEKIAMCDFLLHSPFLKLDHAIIKVKNTNGEVTKHKIGKIVSDLK